MLLVIQCLLVGEINRVESKYSRTVGDSGKVPWADLYVLFGRTQGPVDVKAPKLPKPHWSLRKPSQTIFYKITMVEYLDLY